MNLFIRYPVRFSIPSFLLLLTLLGSGSSYLFYSASRDKLIEKQAIHFVDLVMKRNQIRMNDILQKKEMERLRLNVDLLARTGGPGATLVVDEKQQIISASDPTWLGQSLAKAVILDEGRQRLADFFRTQEKTLQSVVFLSRDRQAVCAIFPLRIGASQDSIGFLYYEKNLQGLKAAAHQTLRRDIGVLFTLFAIIALLLWLFLYFFFFRRVSVIMETMSRFGHGEDSARSMLAGNDELADVATILNSMLDQRVAADKLARETDRLLKQLTDGLPLLLAYVDKEEHYRIVNREFEKWFYLKPEQIIGRQVRDMLGAKGLD